MDSKDNLEEFLENYRAINDLMIEYKKGVKNRKELSKEILEKIDTIHKTINSLQNIIDCRDDFLKPDEISDLSELFKILIEISNNEDAKYSVAKINIRQHVWSINPFSVDIDVDYGLLFICGEKNIIDGIDAYEEYYDSDISDLIQSIIEQKHSVVFIPCAHNDVIPIVSSDITQINFDLRGYPEKAYGFVFDDSLGKTIIKMKEYVNVYGGDMDDIPTNVIIDRIKELEEKNISLTKTRKEKKD